MMFYKRFVQCVCGQLSKRTSVLDKKVMKSSTMRFLVFLGFMSAAVFVVEINGKEKAIR